MPFDEDHDDEVLSSGLPLPAEDRLWRHPSEVGTGVDPAVEPAPLATATAPGFAPAPPLAPLRPAWSVVTAAGAAGAAIALGVVALAGWWGPPGGQRQAVQAARSDLPSTPTSARSALPVAEVVERVGPSVAQLKVDVGGVTKLGSGVVLGPAGYLVTSAAVVGSQATAKVSFSNGTSFDGRVVSIDAVTALAVIHVDSTSLRTPELAPRVPRVGDPALAVSGPTDPAGTGLVTAGMVSGQSRSVSFDGGELHDMVETDRPVPEESDGGALVDGDGAVAGVCVRPGDAKAGSVTAAGWAVPVQVATRVVTDVAMTGQAHHGWIGAEVTDAPVTTSLASAGRTANAGDRDGPVVQSVSPASPAARAGLHPGDVVTVLDHQPITSRLGLISVVRRHQPGDRVTVEFWHDGDLRTGDLVFQDRPAS